MGVPGGGGGGGGWWGRGDLECKWRSLFKALLYLVGDLDFLFVTHQLEEEMLKGRNVEEGSGSPQNDSEAVGSSVAFVPGNVDH